MMSSMTSPGHKVSQIWNCLKSVVFYCTSWKQILSELFFRWYLPDILKFRYCFCFKNYIILVVFFFMTVSAAQIRCRRRWKLLLMINVTLFIHHFTHLSKRLSTSFMYRSWRVFLFMFRQFTCCHQQGAINNICSAVHLANQYNKQLTLCTRCPIGRQLLVSA